MENASKALIMAGSVLIALLIIGALILMFNSLSSYQKTNVEGTRSSQIVEFNNQYDTYDRKNVRGSDLYSLLNKVIVVEVVPLLPLDFIPVSITGTYASLVDFVVAIKLIGASLLVFLRFSVK